MKIANGIDLVEIARVQSAVERHGERFLARIFTAQERTDCGGRAESMAARWAAKEAAAKALGCGLGEVAWDEIEITRSENGAPGLVLHGKAQARAQTLGLIHWSVSLSHSQSHAIAMVVALGEE
jgi:holo-[acyl-carrier protein] synthase